MFVEVADILAKIPTLPADYAAHVHLGEIVAGALLAEVDSFSEHTAPRNYALAIKRGQIEGELDATCTCAARTLCKHIVAFYAVAKADNVVVAEAVAQIAPRSNVEPVALVQDERLSRRREEGLRRIAAAKEKFDAAIQDLVDGIALYTDRGV